MRNREWLESLSDEELAQQNWYSLLCQWHEYDNVDDLCGLIKCEECKRNWLQAEHKENE